MESSMAWACVCHFLYNSKTYFHKDVTRDIAKVNSIFFSACNFFQITWLNDNEYMAMV